MNSEINRLHTFSRWPTSAPVDPARLARGGFFYTGEGTEVQCFSCNAKISNWNYGDQVMSRHRLVEPQCTYVVHPSLSGNVTIGNVPRSPSWNEEVQYQPNQPSEEPDAAVTRSTSDYGLTEDDEIYRSDALRLLSFVNWEDASVSREALVNAGFYHAGGGRLRCAWCGGELAPYNNLGSLGSPLEIHRMYFPRCDHAATIMASLQSANLPLSSSPFDTPPIRSPMASDTEPQSSGAAHNSRILNGGTTWRALGVVGGGAKHAVFSSIASRLSSFCAWPADRTQTPLALAEAGFFHTGTDDQVDEVRCFYCDGGLGKWESGDAPWSEHARWFPSCGYVLLVKGQEFVDSCSRRAVRNVSTESRVPRRNPDLPVTEDQINECLESSVGMGALSAGLDAARVKRAIARRLRAFGAPFQTPEALIDAVLDEQLNEEAWSVTSNSQRFARDILAETLQEFVPRYFRRAARSDSQSDSTRSPSPAAIDRIHPNQRQNRSSQNRSPIRGSPSYRTGRNNSPRQRSSSQNRTLNQRSTSQNRTSIQNRAASQNRPFRQNRSSSPNRSSSLIRSSSPDRSPTTSSLIRLSSPDRSPTTSSQDRSQNQTELEDPRKDNDDVVVRDDDIEFPKLSLEEENRQLKESRICKVCMDNEVSVVFLPCGHLVSCARCGAALSACPLCRASVKALVRAYLA